MHRWSTSFRWLPLGAATWLWSCSCGAPHTPHGKPAGEATVIGQSWDVCAFLGPHNERPGIYGSDLGYSVRLPKSGQEPSQLAMLFGDTWAAQTDACAYPLSTADDLQALLPAARPSELVAGEPTAAAAQACDALHYDVSNLEDPSSWPRIHVYKDANARSADNQLDTGMLRTPVSAFSDGQHVFGAFVRDDAARCKSSSDCPARMLCSSDPEYTGKRIGGCAPQVNLAEDADPKFCINDADCGPLSLCTDLNSGVCLAAAP